MEPTVGDWACLFYLIVIVFLFSFGAVIVEDLWERRGK